MIANASFGEATVTSPLPARKAARSLTAAYLNATHADVNYPKSTAELTAMWDAAVGDDTALMNLHTELDEYNNYGCSIE